MLIHNKKIIYLLLTAIFLLGLFLRIFLLSKFPVSLTIDEVAQSYNAYSILKTGKDEWGESFPLLFRSIGDYKSPLLIYTMIPATALFGLTEFGARSTVALIAALTVIIVYLLVMELSKNNSIALLTSLSLAISPWHITPSRVSHEAVLGLALVLGAAYIFLKAINSNLKLLWLSSILFVLSMYAYHVEKLFTPLLIFSLTFIFRKNLWAKRKESLLTAILGAILLLPLIFVTLSPQGRTRATMTFLTQDVEINSSLHKVQENLSLPSLIFDNNFIQTFNFWAGRFLDYFDLDFLFVDGMEFTIPNSPDVGLLHLPELPFFLIGIFAVYVRREIFKGQFRTVLVFWLLLGPLAASLTNNAQHPVRSLTMIPIPQLLVGIGVWYIFQKIGNIWHKRILAVVLSGVIVFSTLYFMNLYFINFQLNFSEGLMDGWREAAKYGLENKQYFKEVVMDPRFGTQAGDIVGTPYLYVLFYGQIDPAYYQSHPRRKEAYDSANFDQFTFRNINWVHEEGSDKFKKNILFIGSPWVLPVKEDQILKRFYIYNGKEILRAVTVK